MNSNIVRGVIAGLIATVVLTLILGLKAISGFMPDINLTALFSGVLKGPAYLGLIVYFLVGTLIWGPLFALLARRIPGSTCVVKAVVFSAGAWVIMQLVVLPLAGMGPFGVAYGLQAPALTFVLYMLYGVVLGVAFPRLKGIWHVKGPGAGAEGALRYTHY